MDKYRIMLISPGLSAERQAGALKDIANVLPTLGIGYIASVLEKNDFEVGILDCIGEPLGVEQVAERVTAFDPGIIGITATILTINAAYAIARRLKEYFPHMPVIIGGPQFSSNPAETIEKEIFDLGVIGEGEDTFLEISKAFRSGNFKADNIKGVAYKDNGNIKQTDPRSFITDMDSIPFPARHLYPPLSVYKPVPASYIRKPVGLMITSRGCPYQCIFCDRSVFGNRFRAHSPAYVVDEMKLLIDRFGAREIRFMDDTFTMDMDRVFELCEKMIKMGISVPWTCLTRVNRVTPELLRTMKKAGCWQVIYGLESGDDKMLERMKKGVTVRDNEKAVRMAKKAGLNVRATFVFGMPGETVDSIKRTVEFAKRVDLDVVNFFTVILYPGNELYGIAKKEGKILHSDYEHYTSLIDAEETKLHYIPEDMTERELKNSIVQAYRDYYLRPSFIFKQFLNIKNLEDIERYWSAFKSVVSLRKKH